MGEVLDIVSRCLSYDDEQEWFDFKDSWFEVDGIGEYISSLSNAALLAGEAFGYLIWGIHNDTHKFTNTKIKYKKDINSEPFEHYLARNISPAIYFNFEEEIIDGNRVVVLIIPAARIVPTEYKGVRYIRVGSSKENIKKHPEREAALFKALNYGTPNLLNTPSRFKKLSFEQLFMYYETKGIKLREDTFKENLELLTADGQYNMLAQLLSDDPHIDIQFGIFTGTTKNSTMYLVRNFGHMCLLCSLDKVLDFGDTLNVPQADERNRKVQRKEVMLFNALAFREAVINAFVHNTWTNEDAPMFTAFKDRIEIRSMGKLPPQQTKEGFYRGRSIPVNKKLSEIFIQLHISEKTGRGVPRIIEACGKDAFEFEDNSLLVTIPFNRINISEMSNDTGRADKKDPHNFTENGDNQNSKETTKRLPRDYQETTKTPPRDHQGKEKNTVEIIREIMVGNPYITAKEIAEAIGLSINGVQYHIKKMKSSGKLERQGGDYGGRWIVK